MCGKGRAKKKIYTTLSKKRCYVKYIRYGRLSGHGFEYDAVTLIDFSGQGGELFEGELRQERAVEREASWGITKLRVDGGHAIDGSEATAAGGAAAGTGCIYSMQHIFN